MGIRNPHFPWRLFWRSFLPVSLGFTALILVLGFSLRAAIQHLSPDFPMDNLDPWLEAAGAIVLTLSLGAMVWLLYTSFRPLARLRKAIKTDELWFTEGEDLGEDEPEEWAEVSHALQRLSRELESKTQRTNQEESEIETLMRGISDAVIAIDRKGHPLFFNRVFEEMFGTQIAQSGQALLGELVRAPEVLGAFQKCIREGDSVTLEVELFVGRETLARHFRLTLAPLRVHEWSQVYGGIGIFHDISELKRAEQIRIDFVANVSHEIRTPLTAVKGYTEILSGMFSEKAETLKYFDGIRRNVDRMIALVSDLLDLSTLESGGAIEMHPCSPREMTEAVLRNLEHEATAKSQTLTWECQVESLYCDIQRVEQVLTNLVQNSIKYCGKGSAISVTWSGEGGQIVLRVRDNGPGIPVEHLPRLFERFYRVDKARSREIGGTGLGLSIVKHIMRRHSGQVEVLSEPGRGSEFVCRFPILESESHVQVAST